MTSVNKGFFIGLLIGIIGAIITLYATYKKDAKFVALGNYIWGIGTGMMIGLSFFAM